MKDLGVGSGLGNSGSGSSAATAASAEYSGSVRGSRSVMVHRVSGGRSCGKLPGRSGRSGDSPAGGLDGAGVVARRSIGTARPADCGGGRRCDGERARAARRRRRGAAPAVHGQRLVAEGNEGAGGGQVGLEGGGAARRMPAQDAVPGFGLLAGVGSRGGALAVRRGARGRWTSAGRSATAAGTRCQVFLGCRQRGRRGGAVATRKAHAGAGKVGRKKGGDCQLKLPNFGLPAEGRGEGAVVQRLREGARGGGAGRQQEVRGLAAAAAKFSTVGGGEGAGVLWLCEGAREGGGRRAATRARWHERQGCSRKRRSACLAASRRGEWRRGGAAAWREEAAALHEQRPEAEGSEAAVGGQAGREEGGARDGCRRGRAAHPWPAWGGAGAGGRRAGKRRRGGAGDRVAAASGEAPAWAAGGCGEGWRGGAARGRARHGRGCGAQLWHCRSSGGRRGSTSGWVAAARVKTQGWWSVGARRWRSGRTRAREMARRRGERTGAARRR